MTVLADLLLAVTVAVVWLACLGFARLRTAFDRLHCAGFVGAAAGLPLLLAAWLSQATFGGGSATIAKLAFLLACLLFNGAALSHATGRALHHRSQHEPE
ncbi:MAG TPA: monovalent cation/H(+) antiporter subunit G [Acetobacteraceae bacterium]